MLLVDNYDSFTYNLVHRIGELGVGVEVRRNDQVTVEEALGFGADAIVISPGPGLPAQSGICVDLVRAAAAAGTPLLGVCLGHQSIGEAFGGKTVQASDIVHGKTGKVNHDESLLFRGLPAPLTATRYHSLVTDRETLPGELEVTAWLDDGTIMGLSHKSLPIHGVQFHPESIATESGQDLLANFVRSVAAGG